MMQSYPARALGRKLQVDWARDPREGPKLACGASMEAGSLSFNEVL